MHRKAGSHRIGLVFAVPMLAGMALSGCSNGPTAYMSPKHPYDFVYDDSTDAGLAALRSKIQGELEEISALEREYYSPGTTSERQKVIRQRIVGILVVRIDDFWRRYRSSFYGRTATLKTGMETLSGTLSGAAAITTPARAASILAALSTAATGLSTSLEKNLLQENTADLLLSQMEADRQAIGLRIRLGNTKSVETYPLVIAMQDLAEYASSMSVPSALASLRAKAGQALQTTKDLKNQKTQLDARKEIDEAKEAAAKAEQAAIHARGQADAAARERPSPP